MSWRNPNNLIINGFTKIKLERNNAGEFKKNLQGQRAGMRELTKSSIMKTDTAFGLLVGEQTGIFVMDFDCLHVYYEWVDKFPIILEQPRIKTRKGFHIYWKYIPKYWDFEHKLINPHGREGNIDLMFGKKNHWQVFYEGTSYITENKDKFTYKFDANKNNELIELPDDMYNTIVQEGKNNQNYKENIKTNDKPIVDKDIVMCTPIVETKSQPEPITEPKKKKEKKELPSIDIHQIKDCFELKNGNITDLDIDIANCINGRKYLSHGRYEEWTLVVWALKEAGYSKEFAIKLSKTGYVIPKNNLLGNNTLTEFDANESDWELIGDTHFDLEHFENIWNATTTKKVKLSKKSIYKWAYDSNPQKCVKLQFDYYVELFNTPIYNPGVTDYSIVQLFMKHNNDVVYDGNTKKIYTYFKNKWYEEDDKQGGYAKSLLRHTILFIGEQMVKWGNTVFRNLKNEQDPTKEALGEIARLVRNAVNYYESCIDSVKKQSELGSLWREIQLQAIEKVQKFEFDSNGDILAFDNMKFNFITNTFQPFEKNDYITMHTGYDWIEPEQTELDRISGLISKIFPNTEIKKTYLSILLSSLKGYTKDKFIIANGNGGNGKGVINELMMYLLGDYAFEGCVGTLVDKMKTGGSNPEIAGMHNKRLVRFKEPNEGDRIKLGNLKSLCDNDTINARMNYSNNTKTCLKATFILENNKRLKFDGEAGDAEARRLVDVCFETTFTDDPKILSKKLDNVFMAEEGLKTQEFKKKHACALFKYLISNAPKKIYVADCVKERTDEYIASNSDLFVWFKDNYIENEGSFIKCKYIYESYRESNEWETLERKNRPKLNAFVDNIRGNKHLKMYYKDRYKISQKTEINKVLVGWRAKTDDEKDDDSDDDEEEEKNKEGYAEKWRNEVIKKDEHVSIDVVNAFVKT